MEFKFPEYSKNIFFCVKPDIIVRENHAKRPMFDLILGVETLVKFGVILDFKRKVLTIDHHELTMRPLGAFSNIKKLYRIAKGSDDLLRISPNITPKSQFPKAPPDPIKVRNATDRVEGILDATYEKADLPNVINENYSHLSSENKAKLLRLLQKFEELFDGTLGNFQTDAVSFSLRGGAKPYHGKAFPIPHVHKVTFKREVMRLVELGVLKE